MPFSSISGIAIVAMAVSIANSDGELIEPLSNPIFWLLAVLIPTFWFATVQSSARFDSPAETKTVEPQNLELTTHCTRWLHPYLISSPRIFLAIVIYLLILALELLEGWWVLSLDWRVLSGIYLAIPSSREEGWHTVIPYVPAVGAWLVFSAVTIIAGAMILLVQVVCIAELAIFLVKGPQDKVNLAEKGSVLNEDIRGSARGYCN